MISFFSVSFLLLLFFLFRRVMYLDTCSLVFYFFHYSYVHFSQLLTSILLFILCPLPTFFQLLSIYFKKGSLLTCSLPISLLLFMSQKIPHIFPDKSQTFFKETNKIYPLSHEMLKRDTRLGGSFVCKM